MMAIMRQTNLIVNVFNYLTYLECHLSCETCVTINTNCLSCLNISYRILTNNKCLCIDGYYDAGIELC